MHRGTLRARVSTAILVLALGGCGSSAVPTVAANPVPTAPASATQGSSPSQTIFAIESPSAGGLDTPTAAAAGHHWTGTEHSFVVFGPGCNVTADATLSPFVSTGGQVSGTAKDSWLYICGKMPPQSEQDTIPITGTLSITQFVLTIPLGLGMELPVTVPLTSTTRAHVDGAAQAPQRTYTIDLTCSDC